MLPSNLIYKTITIISCKIYKVHLLHLFKIIQLRFFKITVTEEINKSKILFKMEEILKEVKFDKVQTEYNKMQIN